MLKVVLLSLGLLLSSAASSANCETAAELADFTVNQVQGAGTVPKILCPGIEYEQFARQIPEGLQFTFLNHNETVPLHYVDVHYKVVDKQKMRQWQQLKGEDQLGHLTGREKKRMMLDRVLREDEMGELVNKRMRKVRLTRGEAMRGAAESFKFLTGIRLKPTETVVYNMTYSDSVECDAGPWEYRLTDRLGLGEERRKLRLAKWLQEAGGAPRLPCPGIQYRQFVRKTPDGLVFTFMNFNKTIELNFVDVHYRIDEPANIPLPQRRLPVEEPFGTQINKRMVEVRNLFKRRVRGEEEGEIDTDVEIDEEEERIPTEATQVFQHVIAPLEAGQTLRYNMTYSNAVECDIGEFSYTERPSVQLVRYRPPVRGKAYRVIRRPYRIRVVRPIFVRRPTMEGRKEHPTAIRMPVRYREDEEGEEEPTEMRYGMRMRMMGMEPNAMANEEEEEQMMENEEELQ